MEKIKQWPADNEMAMDRLERHSIERARVDPQYFAQHRDWYRWAERETVRRAAEQNRAHRLEVGNAMRQEALESRDRARQDETTERGRQLDTQREARNVRLAANMRRLP